MELLKKWEQRSINAATRQHAHTQAGNHHQADRFFDRRCAFDARIVELRRTMGLSDYRQPEAERSGQPRRETRSIIMNSTENALRETGVAAEPIGSAPTPYLDRCPHCGSGDEHHHSYSCPTKLHPDKRGKHLWTDERITAAKEMINQLVWQHAAGTLTLAEAETRACDILAIVMREPNGPREPRGQETQDNGKS